MHGKSPGKGRLRPLEIKTLSIKDGARRAAAKPPSKYADQRAPEVGTPKRRVGPRPKAKAAAPKVKPKHKFLGPRGYGAAGAR